MFVRVKFEIGEDLGRRSTRLFCAIPVQICAKHVVTMASIARTLPLRLSWTSVTVVMLMPCRGWHAQACCERTESGSMEEIYNWAMRRGAHDEENGDGSDGEGAVVLPVH